MSFCQRQKTARGETIRSVLLVVCPSRRRRRRVERSSTKSSSPSGLVCRVLKRRGWGGRWRPPSLSRVCGWRAWRGREGVRGSWGGAARTIAVRGNHRRRLFFGATTAAAAAAAAGVAVAAGGELTKRCEHRHDSQKRGVGVVEERWGVGVATERAARSYKVWIGISQKQI